MKKSEIRREILKNLKALKREEKTKKDKIIEKKLLSLPEFEKAKVIAFYVSMESEVDTRALIDRALATGKRVVVPVTIGDDLKFQEIKNRKAELVEGPYGILQPAHNSHKPFLKDEIDIIVVPGVAFGRDGTRLGRGKGFYDRFLKRLPSHIKKVGLAYDLQIIEDLPTTPHDFPVDVVVTN